MRNALLAVCLAAAACHPMTLGGRAHQLGGALASAGHRVAAHTGRLADSIDPDTATRLAGAAGTIAVAAASEHIARSAPAPAPVPDAPPQAPAPVAATPATPATEPAITIARVDDATPTQFFAHYQTASGAWTCSAYPTIEACTQSCTAIGQSAGLSGAPAQCNCVEDTACR